MKIYTSYFGNLRKLQEAGIKPIGIALYPPKWFRGSSYQSVAPRRYMLNDAISEEEYTRMYQYDVLSQVDPYRLLEHFKSDSQGRDIALLCYEKPGDFCHRHIFAKWFQEKMGIEIEEFQAKVQAEAPEVSKEPEAEQQSLF